MQLTLSSGYMLMTLAWIKWQIY